MSLTPESSKSLNPKKPAVDAGCPVLLVLYSAVVPHAPDSRLRAASDSAFTMFRRHP